MRICSACLLGLECAYDGRSRKNKKVVALSKKETLIPVCPEQLGGLPTPREPSEQIGRGVFTKLGEDVLENFNKGALEVLRIVILCRAEGAILKQRSPSCGSGQIHDGTFSGKIIIGDGVTASLLKENGVNVITEEDL